MSLTGRDECWSWRGTATCVCHHTLTSVLGTGLEGETGGGQEEREVKKVRNRGIDRESKRRDRDMTVGFKRGISVRAYKEQNSRETESKDPQRKVRK